MLHPRTTMLNGKEVLVTEAQMVAYREHLTQTRRMLFLTGFIGMRCPQCLMGETESHNLLMALDSISHDPITIVITSPGGFLEPAFLFYDTMRMIQSPIVTIGRSCASAAALLFAAGSKRYLLPHAKLMLHMATGQAEGDVKDQKIQIKQMEESQNKIIDILLECGAKKSREEILNDIDRDFWLSAEEAIAYGLADGILTPKLWESMLKG